MHNSIFNNLPFNNPVHWSSFTNLREFFIGYIYWMKIKHCMPPFQTLFQSLQHHTGTKEPEHRTTGCGYFKSTYVVIGPWKFQKNPYFHLVLKNPSLVYKELMKHPSEKNLFYYIANSHILMNRI